MWIVRAYNTTDEELRAEVPLADVDVAALTVALRREPSPYVSTPLTAADAGDLIARYARESRSLSAARAAATSSGLEFFLDFDAPQA